MVKQEKWNCEMYKICCKKYLYFIKGYEKFGADRGTLINDIIDNINDSLNIKINKMEDVDEKLNEIQVLVNTYYPIYKEPIGISYEPTDECCTAFCVVVDEVDNIKPLTEQREDNPKPEENPKPMQPDKKQVSFDVFDDEKYSKQQPIQPVKPKINKTKDVHFENPIVPLWSDLEIGQNINHMRYGKGKIINIFDNGIVKILDLEFLHKDKNGKNYVNAFFYPLAFKKGCLLETKILLQRLRENNK